MYAEPAKINPEYKGPRKVETYAYKKKIKESILGNFVKRYFIINLDDSTFSYKKKSSSKSILFQIALSQINKVSGECESKGPWPFGISVYTMERVFSLFFQNSLDYNIWIEALCAIASIPVKPDLKMYVTH